MKKYNLRKPSKNNKITQGLKIGIYGVDGVGKTTWVLKTFNDICVIDTESKIGVYEKQYPTIASILDTNDYKSILAFLNDVVTDKDLRNNFSAVLLDSENNMFEVINSHFTNLEENKALKNAIEKKKSKLSQEEIEDIKFNSAITIRGYGKLRSIKNAYKSSKVQISNLGWHIITIAHSKPIKNKDGVVIGTKADFIDDGKMHEYDIVLEFKKEKSFDGGYNYVVIPKKDTTNSFELEKELDNQKASDILKEYLINNYEREEKDTNYSNISNEIFEEEDNILELQNNLNLKEKYINIFKENYKNLSDEKLNKSKEILNKRKVTELNTDEIENLLKEINLI